MKNKLTFLLATLFLLTLSPQADAKDYCGEVVNIGGKSLTLTFEKVSGTINGTSYQYRAIFVAPSNTKLTRYQSAYPGDVFYEGNGTNEMKFYFNNKPTACGTSATGGSLNWICIDNAYSNSPTYIDLNSTGAINWDATCGPVLAITSATLASKTSSEIVLNVTSTEATKYKVVCSQFTRELTVSFGTVADGQITLSGLTPSTTYNLTVYAMDNNGNTSSSSKSLSVTTDAPPAENIPPTISNLSYVLTGNGYSTANITVQATDNVGITRVEIKNGSTGLLNQGVTSTTSLNQAFAVSGLPIGATTTLTVIVYDAAGNNASKTISVKTNAPNPQMTSASVASTTQNSVTLNVASTGGNGYKVTYGGNTINTTATDGKITITGLNSGTSYTFTVYAMYDTYECSNPITIKAKTVEVGCSGTQTIDYAGTKYIINYKINYIGGNILFTAWCSTEGKPFTSCKLNYCTNTSGSGAVNDKAMSITNGEATYTLPASGLGTGNLYFTFKFSANGMNNAETSTSASWSGAYVYPIGGCALDDGMPYMLSASKESATKTTITLNVDGVVNIDGVETPTTQYEVTYGSTTDVLNASDGKVTIGNLEHSTSYTFTVKAVYNDTRSNNYKLVTTSTMKASQCSGVRGHHGYTEAQKEANPRVLYEIGYENDIITMTFIDEDKENLDFLEIHWNIPGKEYASVNNLNNGPVKLSGTTATYTIEVTDESWIGCAMGMYVLYSNTDMDGNLQTGTTDNPESDDSNIIYYVVGECGTADTKDPVIVNAFVSGTGNTSANIRVVATDDTGITLVTVKDNNGQTVLTQTVKRLTSLDATYTLTGLEKNTTYSGYTVTVTDRADKSVTVPLADFTTTNTPDPIINSAAVSGDPLASSVVLAVTATEANQYKVVEINGLFADKVLTMSSGDAADGTITVTGLKPRTEYSLRVYAMYDNTVSANYKDVTFTTPIGSECSGTRGHFANKALAKADFFIDYEPSTRTITWTLNETLNRNFTFVKIEWYGNGEGGITAGNATSDHSNANLKIAISGSQATYSYQVPEDYFNKEMLIRFLFNVQGVKQTLTAEGTGITDPNIIYYKIGECGCEADDGNKPVLGDVSLEYTTPYSAVLNVSATDASSIVDTYEVEVKLDGTQISKRDYFATDGQITISGLTSCKTYTFIVKAKDPSCNLSDNSVTISGAKTTTNHILGGSVTAEYNYNVNVGHTGTESIDGNLLTRGGSQDLDVDDLATALDNGILTITLPAVKYISEIDIYWERACATDYELQASIDGTNWSTIKRYTEMPEWTVDTDVRSVGEDNMVYRFYEMPAKYLRVKPNMLYIASQWGMSIYEFEAYGPCDVTEKQCPVVLDVRGVSTKAQSAVISVSAIDQQTHDQADLTYIVTATTDVPGRRTLTNTYTFTPNDGEAQGRKVLDEKIELTLNGLIPGTYYTFTVQAKDPQDNMSCNSNSVEIRTGKADGCGMISEGSDANVVGDWKAYPSGMSYRFELNNNDAGTEFTADLTFNGIPDGKTIGAAYIAVEKQASEDDGYAGWVEVPMTYNDATGGYTITLNESSTYEREAVDVLPAGTYRLFTEWPEIEVSFKIELSDYGIIHSNPFTYNVAERTCEELFIIFHENSQPADDMMTYYTGNTISNEIYYYRLVNPGEWTPLCLPFEVNDIQVYNPSSRKYYSLKAQTNSDPDNNAAGTTTEGSFWLRQQVEDVSGENFQKSWFDDVHELPQKDIAYNFRVPAGTYYQNKYIIFRGAANQTINTTFTLGEAASGDDAYRLYGNTTMMPQAMAQAYKEDDDGKYYRRKENWTLNPFECYVIAAATTMARMPIIGRWTSPGTATGFENVTADTILPEIYIYTTLGQPVAVLKQTSLVDATQYLQQTAAAGCYILSAQGATSKVLIP